MSGINGPAPGFADHPDHAMVIAPSTQRWTASIDGSLLADSRLALVLREANYKPVTYFPLADVNVDQLTASSNKTVCPFKGEASYFSVATANAEQDIAWSYPETYTEAAPIAGYVAFYADRVAIDNN